MIIAIKYFKAEVPTSEAQMSHHISDTRSKLYTNYINLFYDQFWQMGYTRSLESPKSTSLLDFQAKESSLPVFSQKEWVTLKI